MRPARILAIDYVGESRRAQQLRGLFGTYLTAKFLRIWRNIAARVPTALSDAVQKGQPIMLNPGYEPDYDSLAQRVLRLTVNSYADPRLLDAMRDCGVRTFLYCSGGRVPATMFHEDFRILHIHPGVVPQIRGSDGLLWSLLVRGQPGASCFYMDAGIDTGQLIATTEFENPRWSGLQVEPEQLYHALIHCYDPHLRASLLVWVLAQFGTDRDLADLEATVQQYELGGHYYTMHPAIRSRILARLCE